MHLLAAGNAVHRFLQKLTIVVGEPIDLTSVLNSREDLRENAVTLRKQVTDVVQHKLYELKSQAEALHKDWTVLSPVAHRTL